MVCCLTVLLLMGCLEVLMLTRSFLMVIAFIFACCWIVLLIALSLGAKMKFILWNINQSFSMRMASIVLTITFIYIVAQINVFSCIKEPKCTPSSKSTQTSFLHDHYYCPLPHYIILTCILTFLSVVVFLRVPIVIKGLLLVPMTLIFIVAIQFVKFQIFYCYDERVGSIVPEQLIGLVVIIHFLIAVFIHGRQVEWTARLDFLWNLQANEEKHEMHELQNSNRRILFNLLPAHVATHFLDNQFKNNMDLYNQSYSKVGVVFASIPNFHEFYMELDGNNQGMECLRLLNEIIADFDELLDDERFKSIDKIKTVGSTYMAAIGLMPEFRIIENDPSSAVEYMSILAEMVFAFKDKLADINENSYNNFFLRVGINVGPVVAGVIGASKPQYDIWGNTVNVASRMDSTGLPNHVQVTEEVYTLLKGRYVFQCRGTVKVKGKGDMTTYFLLRRKTEADMLETDEIMQIKDTSCETPRSSLENSSYHRGRKSHMHLSGPTNEIHSTSSPRLPSMQLPPWQPRTQQSTENDSSDLYNQPKPIIGNTKSYSQTRPRYNQSLMNSSHSNSSLHEGKEDLQEKLQKLNSGSEIYTNKVYRPSKMYTHPRSHSINKSPLVLTPPEELHQSFSILPMNDSESAVASCGMSSSHDSLLGHDKNISGDSCSLNRSSMSSCDSYIHTDVDSPALYDYQWVYPIDNAKDSLVSDGSRNSSDNKLPEVGLSPSHNSACNNCNNVLNFSKLNQMKGALNYDNSKIIISEGVPLSPKNITTANGSNFPPLKDCLQNVNESPVESSSHSSLSGMKEQDESHSDMKKNSLKEFYKNSGSHNDQLEYSKYECNIPLQNLHGDASSENYLNGKEPLNSPSKPFHGEDDTLTPYNYSCKIPYSNSQQNDESSKSQLLSSHSTLKSPSERSEESSNKLPKDLVNNKYSYNTNLQSPQAIDRENYKTIGDEHNVSNAASELTDSDESDDDKAVDVPLMDDYCNDDPALENASLLNEHGLTDAEGALSDLNSIINDPCPNDGDMDDTSISSRASSRMFDSDQLLSVDSLNIMYDSEYDNYRPGIASDDDIFHQDHGSEADIEYLEDPNMEHIRMLSNNITQNFGLPSKNEKDSNELG